MSEVMRSLSKLGQVVNNLEGSVEYLEASKAGEQRDMFASPAPIVINKEPSMDKELVTKKLDLAIEQIEEMLEGEGVAHG